MRGAEGALRLRRKLTIQRCRPAEDRARDDPEDLLARNPSEPPLGLRLGGPWLGPLVDANVVLDDVILRLERLLFFELCRNFFCSNGALAHLPLPSHDPL